MDFKICNKCGFSKDSAEFFPDCLTCKTCISEKNVLDKKHVPNNKSF